uniref:Kallikrein-related peptidase 14 variant 3 n=1 Tax=Canis lupus familiaris TaxID=9615 RepID=C7T1J6_CANLF|nr:kallikrein-related peptidase 14 variant 3 [Canis lupus familiaris]ACU82851.1 kallikrein-related peptidase 14 variant 4 [Canis lupus familiaris]ACU82852.1 kallikrein-related peptidase 14 variant 5 [Canis lupus familiaris]
MFLLLTALQIIALGKKAVGSGVGTIPPPRKC